MLDELNTYDWQEAFSYAHTFTREDVLTILALDEGENDGDNWIIFGQLKDGNYFFLSAGCDYTGWDCQAGGDSSVKSTPEEIIQCMLDTVIEIN